MAARPAAAAAAAATAAGAGRRAWSKPLPAAAAVRLTPEDRRRAQAVARGRSGAVAAAAAATTPRVKLPLLPLPQAIATMRAAARARFDETVEIAVGCKLDKGESIRGVALLPKPVGKTLRIAVVARAVAPGRLRQGNAAEDARAAGADRVGSDDLIQEIAAGTIDFDRLIASPEMMPALAKVARLLGPRGLMPNVKSGTVTDQVGAAVKMSKFAREFRADKGGIVHGAIGKARQAGPAAPQVSFEDNGLTDNISAFLDAIHAARSADKKGTSGFVQYAYLSSSMGPGLPLDLATVPSTRR